MAFLVTGAKGFIGRAVTAELSAAGIPWRAFAGDVTRPGDFQAYSDCLGVIHLAGKVRSDGSRAGALAMLKTNIAGAQNALDFAAAQGCSFHLAGTCCYAPSHPPPNREEDPLAYWDDYSYSKWVAENLAAWYANNHGLNAVIYRIFNVYGQGQPAGFFLSDLAAQAGRGRATLQSTMATRDFIHLRDLARLITLGVEKAPPGLTVLNAGSGREVSIAQVLETASRVMGRPLAIEDLGHKPRVLRSAADIGKARALLGWEPRISLEQGMREIFSGV